MKVGLRSSLSKTNAPAQLEGKQYFSKELIVDCQNAGRLVSDGAIQETRTFQDFPITASDMVQVAERKILRRVAPITIPGSENRTASKFPLHQLGFNRNPGLTGLILDD